MRGTAIVLLGLGVGALIVGTRATTSEGVDALRARAIEAQQRAARAAQEARELAARWSARRMDVEIEGTGDA